MQSNEWKIKVEDSFSWAFVKIWFYKEVNGKFYVAKVYADSSLIEVESDPSTEIQPTMIIPRMLWDGLIESFKKEKTTYHEKEVDAELKATKYHLEDMRNLVFHKQPEKSQVSIGTNNGTVNS